MSCTIKSIEQRLRNSNPELADQLTEKALGAWNTIKESKLFERVGNSFMANMPGTKKRNAQDRLIDELNGQSTATIKSGVEELFNENPKLANQVYEDLGFGKLKEKIDVIEDSVELYDKTLNNKKEFINKLFKDKFDFIEQIKNKNLVDAKNFLNKLLKGTENQDDISIKEMSSVINNLTDLSGEEAINKTLDKLSELSNFRFKTIEDELTKDNELLITLKKQKQQALQLYSSYLDTIFPNSKVKDIVYHGTRGYDLLGKEKPQFDKFDKTFIGKGQGLRSDDMAKGFYFGSYKIANRVGTRIIPAILNIEEENATTIRRNTIDFDTKGDVFVAFEPEQIHILGSKQDIEGFKEFIKQKSLQKDIPIKEGVSELFESNPELANAVYSKILTNSGLSAENVLSLLLKDNIIEKQCS